MAGYFSPRLPIASLLLPLTVPLGLSAATDGPDNVVLIAVDDLGGRDTAPAASTRVITPELVVAPDRADWNYQPGDPVSFTIRVLGDGNPLSGARVRYQVGPERFEADRIEAEVPGEGLRVAGGTLRGPGFLRCRAEFEYGGRTYRSLATAGFSPERIEPTQTEPPDFDAFWQARLKELAAIPVAATKTLVPEVCTPDVNVYRVRYETWGFKGSVDSFYGVLAEPTKPGRYPVALSVPGAGVRPYSGEIELAARGLIVLQVGIHGVPIHLPQPLYEDLRHGALEGYPGFNLDQRDRYYYLRVYLGCVRGNDYLVTHERWDGRNLIVLGGSQGGQLAIVTSALDPRVTGTVANYPAYCDVTGYAHERAGGWPHLFAHAEQRTPARLATSAYFDVVNFARRLRAPDSYGWGYNDQICPPTSMFAAYNVITAPKELWLQREMGHTSTPEFSARYRQRIQNMARPAQ